MSWRSGKDPIDEEEQQRLRNEEEARRIEALRKEKEQEPIPQSVLQYVSPPLITVPWSPFGFGGRRGRRGRRGRGARAPVATVTVVVAAPAAPARRTMICLCRRFLLNSREGGGPLLGVDLR